MDSITHIVMGAAIAQAVGTHKLGRKAFAFGALAATIPDFDILATPFLGPFADWKYHRALTHSLWFGPVIGSLMGWGLWCYYGRKMGHFWPWILTMVLAMFAHPLLDACTIYGTQLLAPFSNQRFEVSAISIVDPVYTVAMLIALLLPLIPRFKPHAIKLAVTALGFALLYPLYGWQQNNLAEFIATKQLNTQDVSFQKVTAYTTIFQPYMRRIVVRDNGDNLRVGFVSTFAPSPIAWSCQRQAPAKVRAAILATETGQIFNWFSGNQLSITTDKAGTHAIVTDARYGTPGPSVFGWWGVNFSITHKDDGSITATETGRIHNERDASWAAIKGLMRASYGLPSDFLPATDIGCDVNANRAQTYYPDP